MHIPADADTEAHEADRIAQLTCGTCCNRWCMTLCSMRKVGLVLPRQEPKERLHHQGDGPASSLGPVSMGKEQRAVYSGGLVVEVTVLLKSERG